MVPVLTGVKLENRVIRRVLPLKLRASFLAQTTIGCRPFREKSRAVSRLSSSPRTRISAQAATLQPCEEPAPEIAADTDMA